MAQNKKSGLADDYLHGFTPAEQNRLYEQADILKNYIYDSVDFTAQKNIVEVGCGVGAQTELLLKKFKHLHVDGIDASASQVARAKKHLAPYIKQKRVSIQTGDALNLPFKENVFDGAFVCWLLEHVSEPLGILKEIRRSLRPGGKVICNEVMNSTFFIHPYSPATMTYWFQFNDHQWSIKGDPFVGAKLGNYLTEAGFRDVKMNPRIVHCDNRDRQQRAIIIDYWTDLLLSGAPGLLKAKKVSSPLIKEMEVELKTLKNDKDSTFFYAFMQAEGYA
ncbi:MAG: class I SAM-dependent methyltransferase [Bdellovibrionota bacterium]